MNVKECADALSRETAKLFIGKTAQIRLMLMAILAGGHILLDDLPGSGKTTLIKIISRALGCDMKRIQFTPDLLPSDIIGMTIFDRNKSAFEQIRGPVFANIVMADEINRAIPRTQAALLEAMEEHQVTIDNESIALPEPFLVLATQNPVERESTFALPAAQMDRFFIKLSLGFPDKNEEKRMLSELGDDIDFDRIDRITCPEELLELRKDIQQVFVSDAIKEYIVALVHHTRSHPQLKAGASPRASRCLYQGGKSMAAMQGRDYVTPEDIRDIFIPVTGHRVILSGDAKYTGKTEDEILNGILGEIPVPPLKEEMFHEEYRK